MNWRTLYGFLGSLKLALILLAVLIGACAVGTYYESSINADVARAYVYNAPWFNIWLSVLCINLFCAAAVRYPWKPHQTGFVITHAGIITLLIGGMIDRKFGVEGYLDLNRGADASNLMILHNHEVLVYPQDSNRASRTPFDLNSLTASHASNSPTFPLTSPDPNISLRVADISLARPEFTAEPVENGTLAARYTFTVGPMNGEWTPATWTFEKNMAQLGGLGLVLAHGKPPEPVKPGEMVPRIEQNYVFMNAPLMAKQVSGEPSGVVASMDLDDHGDNPKLHVFFKNQESTYDVLPNLNKELAIKGADDWHLFIKGYYPHFVMGQNGKPTTLSNDPKNPGIEFEMRGPLGPAYTPAPDKKNPHGSGSARGGPMMGGMPKTVLTVYSGDDGVLRYHAKSEDKGEARGDIKVGEEIALPMMPGLRFKIEDFMKSAQPKLTWVPISLEEGVQMQTQENVKSSVYALQVEARSGNEVKTVWVGPSAPMDWRKYDLTIGDKHFSIAYANQFKLLPFYVRLLDVRAKHQEGTTNSFMSYESILSFSDSPAGAKTDVVYLNPKAPIVSGAAKDFVREGPGGEKFLPGAVHTVDDNELVIEIGGNYEHNMEFHIPMQDVVRYELNSQKISMNEPTTFPVSWYGPWLGTNYKFSQASVGFPNNPDNSGVQVLHDPGWSLKWIGALLIVFGIFTMFYLKPYFRRAKPASSTGTQVKSVEEPEEKLSRKERRKREKQLAKG